MREIEFRGKRIDTGEWVCGYLRWTYPEDYPPDITHWNEKEKYYGTIEVIPETIGQYTGLKDKNGVKIYEGDIIRREANDYDYEDTIVIKELFDIVKSSEFDVIKIIGNIHDNPELVGGAE